MNKQCSSPGCERDVATKTIAKYCPSHQYAQLSKGTVSKNNDWRFKNKTSKQPRKRTERQKAIQRADKYFSLYVRLKYADKNGLCKCYTCGRFIEWKSKRKTTHLGHYISREIISTRWHLGNCRVQDQTCNSYKDGKKFEFRNNLVSEKGKDYVEALEERARGILVYSFADINRIADIFKEKFKRLLVVVNGS